MKTLEASPAAMQNGAEGVSLQADKEFLDILDRHPLAAEIITQFAVGLEEDEAIVAHWPDRMGDCTVERFVLRLAQAVQAAGEMSDLDPYILPGDKVALKGGEYTLSTLPKDMRMHAAILCNGQGPELRL